jgi:hypothetical protein
MSPAWAFNPSTAPALVVAARAEVLAGLAFAARGVIGIGRAWDWPGRVGGGFVGADH